jgi:hypothetical protein
MVRAGPPYTDGVAAHTRSCGGFWLYALAGGLIAFSAVSFGAGLFTALPAVLALVLAARVAREPGEPLGLLAGVGLLCVAIAILNAGDMQLAAAWAAAGSVLVAAGTAGFAAVRQRRRRSSSRPPSIGQRS